MTANSPFFEFLELPIRTDMDSSYSHSYPIEDICRYLISHKSSWIDDFTPTDEDGWEDLIINEAETFVEWNKETEDDTYSAELKGWHGIYYIDDYDFDPCGFFLCPEDALQVIRDHGWFEVTDNDSEVTKTVRRRFARLGSREKQWLRDKTVGRFLHKVIEPMP